MSAKNWANEANPPRETDETIQEFFNNHKRLSNVCPKRSLDAGSYFATFDDGEDVWVFSLAAKDDDAAKTEAKEIRDITERDAKEVKILRVVEVLNVEQNHQLPDGTGNEDAAPV